MGKKKSKAGEPPGGARGAVVASSEHDDLDSVLVSRAPADWKRWAVVGALVALAAAVLAGVAPSLLRRVAVPNVLVKQASEAVKPAAVAKPALTVRQIKERAAQQPCKNKHHDENFCHSSAVAGQCDVSPGWMGVMCAASCARCDLLNPKIRCAKETMNVTMVNTYEPGGITKVFNNFLSQPELQGKVEMLSQDPLMAVIRDFVTPYEGKRLLELTQAHLKRSTDQGEFDESGVQEQVVSTGRTSSNAWCTGPCESDATVRNLLVRIANVTLSDPLNFESFQVLRYQSGQKYDVHHDGSNDNHMPAGPRVLTFFLYLSDVDEGGETHFPQLNIKVKPVRGSALIWPSVLDRDPRAVDPRTSHAALPVIKGCVLRPVCALTPRLFF